MNPRTRRLAKICTVAAALTMVGAGCSSDSDDETAGGGNAGTGGSGGGEVAEGGLTCLTTADLYALVGPESNGFANWSDAQALATELGSSTTFPDGPLDITAPGTESGTYDAFIELALQDLVEERAAAGKIEVDDEGEAVESTRKDYSSQANDNAILQGLTGSKTSFGWVGFAFAEDGGEALHEFEVDGGEGCVAPSAETIADGSYPLARDLYIYVDTAKAAESSALCEYVDYYLSDDGLVAVEEAGYVLLSDEDLAATRSAWDAVGAECEPGAGSGNIRISGSSTVEPISQLVKELLNETNGDITVDVDGPGTGDGFKAFCAGDTDISDASRPIKDEEAQACADAGVEYVELKVAYDGITVLTSAENPAVGG